MAYQSKKHRKFVASAVTAAVVASAVAPAAGFAAENTKNFPDLAGYSWAKEAIDHLVAKGAITGYPDGKFAPGDSIKRGEAAKILAEALDLTIDQNVKTELKDAKNHWASSYIAAIQKHNKDIIKGYEDGTFKPEQTITRQELAKMVATAYDLKANPAAKISFKDNTDWGKDQVQALASLGIVNGYEGGVFKPNAKVNRAETAVFVFRTEVPAKRLPVELSTPQVTAVSAINATQLTVTGSALNLLKAEDLTLEGFAVSEITPAVDGKSATVKLATGILPNKEYTLKVKNGDQTQDFKFSFGLLVKSVEVVAATVDEELTGQSVKLKINGVETSIDTLKAAGYEVNFAAVDSTGADATATLFGAAGGSVTTGALASNLVAQLGKDFKVMATVYRGTEVVVSQYATVQVRNLQALATAINSYELSNTTTGITKQKSTTFVVNEKATITKANVTANGDKFDVLTAGLSVKTSNAGVISVNPTTKELTANAPGTATITVTYGQVSKDITFTVTNNARKLTSATVDKSSVTLIDKTVASTATVNVTALDQYGDPIAGQQLYGTHIGGFVTTLTPVPTALGAVTAAATGKTSFVLTENNKAGSGNVYIQDANGNVLANVSVRVTANNVTTTSKLEVVEDALGVRSDDTTLDLNDDKTVSFEINNYTSENVYNDSTPTTGYFVVYNPKVVKTATNTGDVTVLNAQVRHEVVAGDLVDGGLGFEAVGVGSTDVAIYRDASLSQLVAKTTITVTSSAPSITGLTFKSVPTVNVIGKVIKETDALTLTPGVSSHLVSGVSLSKPSAHAVRYDPTTGLLFIDQNDDGVWNAVAGDDYALGKVLLTQTSGLVIGGATIATSADLGVGVGTAPTQLNDKGTLIVKVVETDKDGVAPVTQNILASTTINVDVK